MSFIIQLEFYSKEEAEKYLKKNRSIPNMEHLVNQLIDACEGKKSVIPKIRSMVIPNIHEKTDK